jgi:tetratricopeptide (TPR) repeat protein
MAFGFGFNKQKVLNSAEKFVQQGKLQNAITEYEKILKADPKDLTVQNTVGDLYSRLGESERAIECFKSVGDAYAAQGFTVKAIAMYKKLGKLKSSLDSVLRLAELYTQQGLFNDARAQYKQVAEEFLRTGDMEQAARIFQKILEMDPDNVAMRTKLAEVYIRLGKKTEAWQIFTAAVESLRTRGATSAAEEVVQRMLTLEPGNSEALLLRGRMAFDAGDTAGAIQYLEKVADLDTHVEGLRTLQQAYVQAGRLPEARTLADKLLSVHNDIGAIVSLADRLIASGHFEAALQVYQTYADRLLAANQPKMVETLHALIGHVRGNAAALETLLALLHKAGESTHLTEVYELLAHACVQSGELEKARDYYLKLTQLEPQNQLHARNYQQVVERLGGSPASPSLITVEEGATLVDELEATAPFIDQRYPDDIALAVRAALTDAELFTSYNMPAKAMGPLLAALPKAPRDLRLNQRLAALHTRAGRFAEAAVCCRNLEALYHDAGHPDEATRYGELAGKYEARAVATAPESLEVIAPLASSSALTREPEESAIRFSPPEPAERTPLAATAPAASAARPAGLFWHAPTAASPTPSVAAPEVFEAKPAPSSEIDLSEEWEGALSDESAPPAAWSEPVVEAPARVASSVLSHAVEDEQILAETIAETIQEVRFYTAHAMHEQARAALEKLELLRPDAATLAAIQEEVAAAGALASSAPPLEEVSIEVATVPEEASFATPIAAEAKLAEVESASQFGPWGSKTPPPEPAPAPPVFPAVAALSPPAEAAKPQPTSTLGDLVSDLESSLGGGFLGDAPGAPATLHPPLAAAPQPRPAERPISASMAAASSTAPAAMAAAASGGDSATVPRTFIAQTRPLAPASSAAPETGLGGIDVAGMFGELKQELENGGTPEGEDSETHYNLGVAFREMGLLDEAIGEFQKVCQAVDRGHPFPQLMQTYTWLAQCFLDRGVPEAAIPWYERALELPNLDGETRVALHYELAGSYEAAQNRTAAMKHFLEVYGNNIDYRDVAERIRALKS